MSVHYYNSWSNTKSWKYWFYLPEAPVPAAVAEEVAAAAAAVMLRGCASPCRLDRLVAIICPFEVVSSWICWLPPVASETGILINCCVPLPRIKKKKKKVNYEWLKVRMIQKFCVNVPFLFFKFFPLYKSNSFFLFYDLKIKLCIPS